MNAGILLFSAYLSASPTGAAREPEKVPGGRTFTLEVTAAEPNARTVAIRAHSGAPGQSTGDDPIAMLKAMKPGDRLTISVGDDATGERHSVVAEVRGAANYRQGAEDPIAIKDGGTEIGRAH